MSWQATTSRRRVIASLKWLVAAVVLVFVGRSFLEAQRSFGQSGSFSWSELELRWLVLSGVIYFLAMLPMGCYWWYLIGRLGPAPPRYRTLTAYYVGHLGKYVPGKAMVVVLRAGLLQSAGVSAPLLAVSVFIETFTMMSVGAGLATLLIACQFAEHRLLLGLGAVLLVLSSLPTWPPFVHWALRRLRVAAWSPETETALRRGYTWRVMAIGWLMELAGWSLMAGSLWAVLRALPLQPPLDGPWTLWPRLTASVALSLVAGFLSLLPGGLGVRELVLDQLLKQPFGPVVAPLSAILLRFVWLLTELLVSSILYLGMGRRRPP